MCEANSIWRNRVQNDRVVEVTDVIRPEFGEPVIHYIFIGGPPKLKQTRGEMMLEAFLRYWNKEA